MYLYNILKHYVKLFYPQMSTYEFCVHPNEYSNLLKITLYLCLLFQIVVLW